MGDGRIEDAMGLAPNLALQALAADDLRAVDPRRCLYADDPHSRHYGEGEAPLVRLVRAWRDAAREASEEELSRALEVQLAVLEDGRDCDRILELVAEIGERYVVTRERLLGKWKEHALGFTVGYRSERRLPGSEWFYALVEAAKPLAGPARGRHREVLKLRASHAVPASADCTPPRRALCTR